MGVKKQHFAPLVAFAGLLTAVAGFALLSVPVALIVLGAGLIFVAWSNA